MTMKIISNIITTFLLLLLVFMIGLVVITQVSNKSTPIFLGYEFKTVLSGSMEPEIPIGSLIGIRSVENSEYFQKNDIITYQTPDEILVTHRIIEVKNKGKEFITQGDNNDAPDVESVLHQNIVGIYSDIMIPYLGYVVYFASSPEGSALLMILPGLFIVIYAVYIILNALKKSEYTST